MVSFTYSVCKRKEDESARALCCQDIESYVKPAYSCLCYDDLWLTDSHSLDCMLFISISRSHVVFATAITSLTRTSTSEEWSTPARWPKWRNIPFPRPWLSFFFSSSSVPVSSRYSTCLNLHLLHHFPPNSKVTVTVEPQIIALRVIGVRSQSAYFWEYTWRVDGLFILFGYLSEYQRWSGVGVSLIISSFKDVAI